MGMHYASMDIKLDRERLIKIRKSNKLTQAEVAMRLGISLRTYSDYENTSSKALLSHLEISKLAQVLQVVVSSLWDSIPLRATLFYAPTSNYSAWAKFLADGIFDDLKVWGIPNEKRLREPLLKLVEVYEAGDKATLEDKKLSSSIQRSFDCDDWVHELVAKKDITDVPPKLMIMRVPSLRVTEDLALHPDTDEAVSWNDYNWRVDWRAKIDFTGSDPETNPISNAYILGKAHVFDYWEEEEEVVDLYVTQALKARPDIRFQDEIDVKKGNDPEKENDQKIEKKKDDEM